MSYGTWLEGGSEAPEDWFLLRPTYLPLQEKEEWILTPSCLPGLVLEYFSKRQNIKYMQNLSGNGVEDM